MRSVIGCGSCPGAGGSFAGCAACLVMRLTAPLTMLLTAALTAAPPATSGVTRAAFVDRLRASLDCIAFMRCCVRRSRPIAVIRSDCAARFCSVFRSHRLSQSGGIAYLPRDVARAMCVACTACRRRRTQRCYHYYAPQKTRGRQSRPARSTAPPPISADGNRTGRRRAFARRASRRPARVPR